MALAYTTSPAYHLIAEDDDSKAAAMFDEGHYMQVEVAAMTAASDQPELAREFLAFMLTDGFQGGDPDDELDVSGAHARRPGCPRATRRWRCRRSRCSSRRRRREAERDAALEEWLAALSR